jgi:biopolymer transport protein ExbD
MKLQRGFVKRGRIEMLPLIDIVFLLLVFFIYAMLSMVVHRGIPIDLPEATTSRIDESDYLSLSVEEDGTVYVDKERATLSTLPDILRQRRKEQPDLKLFIGGDRAVRYERVIQVLDVVRQAGISRVAFETKWKETPEKM